MAYLSLDAVSAALYAVLNVAGLTALAPGGIRDAVAQNQSYPFVLYAVDEDARGTGLGTKPGQNQLLTVGVRVHVFTKPSTTKGAAAAGQQVMSKVIELLSVTDALRSSLTSGGYRLCGSEPIYDETVTIGDAVIQGEVVHETVASFRLYVEEL